MNASAPADAKLSSKASCASLCMFVIRRGMFLLSLTATCQVYTVSLKAGLYTYNLYHTAGNKGQAHGGGKKALGRRARSRRKKREPGRGHYDKDRPAILAWVSRQGGVVIHATRDFTVKTVQKAADLAMQVGSKLY